MSDSRNYTVGWICALETEYVAAQSFLDEEHKGPEYVSPHDNNDYTLGKIGKHNVVIAVLPDGEYGTSSAASVARDMLHSFPNVRIGLMVGIGGGAPSSKHDIRLGDIVVSAPRHGESGVFQYDFGKTIQNQSFQPTGFLNQTPMVLRTAINGIKAEHKRKGHQIEQAINGVLQESPRLRRDYKRPDMNSDRLYLSEFVHTKEEETCAVACGDNPSSLVPRIKRTESDDNPAIFYGTIASSNQLMKDAVARDSLAKEKEVLCFEMEAAGLMNHFPCLVIRGICDYADSHKNKEWQGYAAMAAAAYAKNLLCRIPLNKMEAEKKLCDVISSVKNSLDEVYTATQDTKATVQNLDLEQKRGKVEYWLSPPDPSTNFNKALQQRHKGSGLWFLQSDNFIKWRTQPSSFLWLHGIPGCGKTILSSTIIEQLGTMLPSQTILYFYFDFNDTAKQTLDKMIRSLIYQFYHNDEKDSQPLYSLFSSCKDRQRQPTTEELCNVFFEMLNRIEEIWIVLDALDECSTRRGPAINGVLSWIREILNTEQRNVHLLVTSRPEQDIESEITQHYQKDDIIAIKSGLISDDIRAYIHARVRENPGLKRWWSHVEVQNEIELRLIEKADGM
ncbi:hypothetical protein TGAM01_v205645 [Trichoderma gamsii]|uniref:Nephrocystin 3-like N-terminal domain-containing protein n=1 Tax=Trichoderma gamsii TaxID=398673 RepID=A0A2P4ZM34_9HYPO|nr:hypothetical protein TGAM01_v205645 [Trichoderma gamsii]PON25351.1 hypothetical protein TGAM01_v205645 [Trichoderma gamsii]